MGREAELRACVEACIKNWGDRKEFVNRSEEVLGKFHTAVMHVEHSTTEDKVKVFDSVADQQEKENMVKFMLDCVRNRFHAWNKVATLETALSDSPAWKRAFTDVKKIPPYDTVDLRRAEWIAPEESWFQGPRKPIPFFVEVSAICGLALPIFAALQSCSCLGRWLRFVLGMMILLLWPFFEYSTKKSKGFLPLLARGAYGIGIQYRELPCCWAPSRGYQPDPKSLALAEAHQELTQAVAKATAKKMPAKGKAAASKKAAEPMLQKIEEAKTTSRGACFTWGYWFREPQLQMDAFVERGQVQEESQLSVTCDKWNWNGLSAKLEEETWRVKQLPVEGVFDGDCFYFDAPSQRSSGHSLPASTGDGQNARQVWVKLGWLRLSTLRKSVIAIAMLGATLAYASLTFTPGLCVQLPVYLNRQPLRAFFLIDASGSISDVFDLEKEAAMEIIREFHSVYSGDEEPNLYIGLAQFGTEAITEFTLTNDLTAVYEAVPKVEHDCMNQGGCGTNFRAGLVRAQELLNSHTIDTTSFDLVVLMTDGEDNGNPPISQPYEVLSQQTNIIGIYVGTNEAARVKMSQFLCSGATTGCDVMLRADDFEALKNQASEIAKSISGRTEVPSDVVCEFPRASLYALLLLLPLALWWSYLHVPAWHGNVKEDLNPEHKDPERLHTAGSPGGSPGAGSPGGSPGGRPRLNTGGSPAAGQSWAKAGKREAELAKSSFQKPANDQPLQLHCR